jgi:hypothetical protein
VLNRLDGPDFDRVMCIARQIWIRRNKLVFKGEFIHSKTVTQIAVEQLDFHLKVSHQSDGGRRSQSSQVLDKWTVPHWGVVKINWDAALDK